MSTNSIGSKVATGAMWTLMEKLSTYMVGFVVSMVLARLLTPNDFGTVALMTIFFSVASALVDGGFSSALIQKKNADELDFNSVFYLNVSLSILAYCVLFLCAPVISRFFDGEELTLIIRVSAVSLIFNSINAIQNAELIKKMQFHLSFRVTLITSISSAVSGITLAFMGYGVWALVCSSLSACVIGAIARWFIVSWRPRLLFSWHRLRPLFVYGWKMAASELLNQVFVHLNGLLIGKFYSKTDLAFVNRGNSLPRLAMGQIDETLGRVSFPALVMMQDDRERLQGAMRRMLRMSTFLVFPIMTGLAFCSHSILRLLYGPQWIQAAPYMMLACFTFALWPLHTINIKGMLAVGRSDILFKLEIIKKALALFVILISFRLGLFVFMATTAFFLGPISFLLNAWPNRKLLNYTLRMQIHDVTPAIIFSVVEALIVVFIDYQFKKICPLINHDDGSKSYFMLLVGKMCLQVFAGAMIYFFLAFCYNHPSLREVARIFHIVRARFLSWRCGS